MRGALITIDGAETFLQSTNEKGTTILFMMRPYQGVGLHTTVILSWCKHPREWNYVTTSLCPSYQWIHMTVTKSLGSSLPLRDLHVYTAIE